MDSLDIAVLRRAIDWLEAGRRRRAGHGGRHLGFGAASGRGVVGAR
ncbi:MAG: hypothetical protein V9G98_03450 [Candidatus Competibacter sp.]